jgi:tRNA(Arg) A34 adenosine deaminase TadA
MFFSGFKSKKQKKLFSFPVKFFDTWQINKRTPLNYLRFAASLAAKRKCDNQGFYVGAVGIRNDGALVHAFNGSGNHPIAQGHAETRLSRKLDVGSIVYVARYSFGTHNLVIAKPCKNCERVLQSRGVKKIYYSIQNNEYGIMVF